MGKIEAIYAGRYHIAALKSDGTVEVWGWNTLRECEVPEGLTEVQELALGYAYTAALKKDGTVVVWGSGIRDNMPKSKTRTTTYIHKDHRVVEIIDPLGKSTTYTYNDYAELESYTDRYGNTTTYLLNNSTGNVEKIINLISLKKPLVMTQTITLYGRRRRRILQDTYIRTAMITTPQTKT